MSPLAGAAARCANESAADGSPHPRCVHANPSFLTQPTSLPPANPRLTNVALRRFALFVFLRMVGVGWMTFPAIPRTRLWCLRMGLGAAWLRPFLTLLGSEREDLDELDLSKSVDWNHGLKVGDPSIHPPT